MTQPASIGVNVRHVPHQIRGRHAVAARAMFRGRVAALTVAPPRLTIPAWAPHIAAGLVYCHCCRQPLRAEGHADGTSAYRGKSPERGIPCTAHRRSVDGAVVEEALSRVVGVLRLPPDWKAIALADVAADDEARRNQTRRAALQKQLDQAQTWLLRSYIREDQFIAERAEIERELTTLAPDEDAADLDEIAARLDNLLEMWRNATPEQRRDIVRATFDGVWVDLDGRRVVAVQMKRTLRRLRTALHLVQNADVTGNSGRMRNRRGSNT
jgi:hypothetical protein